MGEGEDMSFRTLRRAMATVWATILLVLITVALAAILYTLIWYSRR